MFCQRAFLSLSAAHQTKRDSFGHMHLLNPSFKHTSRFCKPNAHARARTMFLDIRYLRIDLSVYSIVTERSGETERPHDAELQFLESFAA